MLKPSRLKQGDKVAIVSLSSGMLGEEFCQHNLKIGEKRLKDFGLTPVFMPNTLKGITYLQEHPEARATDLKAAFADETIKGIICSIGGDDTYRLLPYLMEDQEFIHLVKNNPKIFTGFSDTTINHLMFYQLGLSTYYGPAFITDLAEISTDMLPYSKKHFEIFLENSELLTEIVPSNLWYEERTDFSAAAIGQERIIYWDEKGFELLQGKASFEGKLLGGCLDSFYDILTSSHYSDERTICEKYNLFPELSEWRNKILFLETSEEKPAPNQFEKYLLALKEQGIFEVISGIILGKPQDETYYQEYKKVLMKVIANPDLSILYNLNFGHATPRCILPYGIYTRVDATANKLIFEEELFD
ncbi:muramoyltetrapeptide carboxypeptidase LdcA involved in peptidoglycan recycling [Enterococcus sp. PF1-24]|uniref:S66 family peptidase n=1 Tax=unclassified Enterococcus TaxID=2608891 RepID=UPI0024772383|nr:MULTISPECIES: S66 peptidase family protein [unclassified Enterococcus]MDH6364124.1 muramoyltetrapeptide carboxypeptidase LdcA involved in peptidoglycan recycling [Enterococcus sp. PFB1-1]MDH6401225.1 muramoyltetrapeptide carboxypeptidase LdcA involved in peptidoglycan recycling [Enterococcus sp. PF1-24]